ncbi:hypothetical protein BGZ51_005949 [Haplosporangium sp. Z 767]|nr:hypothetical protein BGZ51_005949 [Haplosporangium sp. Z 767]KAF9196963.1 hypothetical protein BGZ50_004550 [Haplosporangium sp. Z 11]
MTDFSQERPALRPRGPSLPKLNFLPATHFLPQHQMQSQHPLDTGNDINNSIDIEMDMDMDFDTAPSQNNSKNDTSRPFVSAHPSPEVSDESDCERERGFAQTTGNQQHHSVHFDSSVSVSPSGKRLEGEQGHHRLEEHHREQIQNELALSHHLLLAPIPIPKSRIPSHSPTRAGKRPSFSMHTPPGSASSVPCVPCSDSAAVDALIREQVQAHKITHSTDGAFFWHLGKLSEFSFSDRFVRSRVFEVKDHLTTKKETEPQFQDIDGDKDGRHMAENVDTSTAAANTRATSDGHVATTNEQSKSNWRLRLYPHGRGDRYRDSEYIGLYLHQESSGPFMARRGSALPPSTATPAFSSSAPTPFIARGSISGASRRSISGSAMMPLIRRHATLFLATENGDCLAKQDLVEWFSGSEGGLGFSRMVSRKAVQNAVKSSSVYDFDDEEENNEIGIVAGVIFHDL